VLACVATDAGLYEDVAGDRHAQALLVRQGYPGDAGGRLADQVEALSDQLFVDMMCRLELTWRALQVGTWYFVRRNPATLGEFNWQCDAKNRIDGPYPRLWAGAALALSRRHPMQMAPGGDYSAMDALARRADMEGLARYDASTLGLDRLQFVDSRDVPGIQIADWLVWGCRRCLRGEFADAGLSGRLGRLLAKMPGDDYALVPMLFARTQPEQVAQHGVVALRSLTRHAIRLT